MAAVTLDQARDRVALKILPLPVRTSPVIVICVSDMFDTSHGPNASNRASLSGDSLTATTPIFKRTDQVIHFN